MEKGFLFRGPVPLAVTTPAIAGREDKPLTAASAMDIPTYVMELVCHRLGAFRSKTDL